MDKDQILDEIRRTANANGGSPLGWRRFEAETGIRYYDWFGQYWTRWSDAVSEAGFQPNRMAEAYDDTYLVEKLVSLTRALNRVPVQGDLLITAKNDPTFPSEKVFRRMGGKARRAEMVMAYCASRCDHEDVADLWNKVIVKKNEMVPREAEQEVASAGYVYLLKHGARREYKIGRTNNPIRREGEVGIQLPDKLTPLHYIKTDDPAGVERYWHVRFASKRMEGEWFALTAADVRAFKRWKRIF